MLLKYFYDPALAHASYMVGCHDSGEAIVVDPGRDIGQYTSAAQREGMQIVGTVETHIHADFVSGAREFADRIGTKLFLSDEGSDDWNYLYAADYDAQLISEGTSFSVGQIKFKVLHTPGHTPESISLLLTDLGSGADKPMGIFTGDFVFAGGVGCRGLLEESDGVIGGTERGARELYQSIARIRALPDYLQIWPAHRALSACGKRVAAIPSSTIGYEKMFNPAFQFETEQEFAKYVLAELPDMPNYFSMMKRINSEGPTILGSLTKPPLMPVNKVTNVARDHLLIDCANAMDFASGHVPGSINLPPRYLADWAGWFVDYSEPVFLIVSESDLDEALRLLHKIGVDEIDGYFDADQVADNGLNVQSYQSASPMQLAEQIRLQQVTLVDVRGNREWNEGHIPQALHLFLGHLIETSEQALGDLPIVVHCRAGGLSAIGASILQAAGAEIVINMTGGIQEWYRAGLPTAAVDHTSKSRVQANESIALT